MGVAKKMNRAEEEKLPKSQHLHEAQLQTAPNSSSLERLGMATSATLAVLARRRHIRGSWLTHSEISHRQPVAGEGS